MIDTADLWFLRKGPGIVRRLPGGVAEVFAVDVMEHVFLRRLPVQEESVRIVPTPRLKQIVGVRAKLIAELGNLCFDFQVTSLLSHLTPNVRVERPPKAGPLSNAGLGVSSLKWRAGLEPSGARVFR